MMNTVYRVAIVGAGPAGLSAAIRAAETGSFPRPARSRIPSFQHHPPLPERQARHGRAGAVALAQFAGVRSGQSRKHPRSLDQRGRPTGGQCAPQITGDVHLAGTPEIFPWNWPTATTVCAETVILAIGLQGQPNKLGVGGEDLGFVDYQLDDPDEFDDKVVVVVGAGDSAIETALASGRAKSCDYSQPARRLLSCCRRQPQRYSRGYS